MNPTLHVVDIPLVLRFRGITRRQAVLFEGPAGWAEWSPFVEYDDAEAGRWLLAAVEMATRGYPEPRRDQVPVNAIIPIMTPGAAADRVRESGCHTAKVKVAGQGTSLDDDVARVVSVRDALGAGGHIRIDANAAWSVDGAVVALRELAPFGLEYVEQPVPGVQDLKALRRALDRAGIDVRIAADESVRRSEDPLQVREVADVAILKVQPLAGVGRCLELAHDLGMPVVVSSALDTSVGLQAGLRLAAALPELPMACGLQTGTLLAADVTSQPLLPVDGRLAVRDVDVDALEPVRADAEVRDWWMARLERVAAEYGGLSRLLEHGGAPWAP